MNHCEVVVANTRVPSGDGSISRVKSVPSNHQPGLMFALKEASLRVSVV